MGPSPHRHAGSWARPVYQEQVGTHKPPRPAQARPGSTTIGPWETFYMTRNSDGTVSFSVTTPAPRNTTFRPRKANGLH